MRHLRASASMGAFVLSFGYAIALFNRTAGTLLVVVLAHSLRLNIAQAAGIVTVFFWVYAILQLPAGVLADFLGPRRLAVVGGIVGGAGSLWFAAAHSIEASVWARGLQAAGCAVVFVCLMRHIRANWKEHAVATASGSCIMVGNLGAIASAAPLALLLDVLDWRAVWTLLGAVSFTGSAVLWFVMADAREPRRFAEPRRAILAELRAVVSNPYNQVGLLLLAGLSGTYYALASLWAMPMLISRGISTTTAALQTSLLIAGYALGAFVLGWVGDRTCRRCTLAAATLGAAYCWYVLSLLLGSPSETASFGAAFFALGFCSGGFNLVYALVTERNPVEHAGTVTAYVNIGIFLGAGVAQAISREIYLVAPRDYVAVLAPMLSGSIVAALLALSLLLRAKAVPA